MAGCKKPAASRAPLPPGLVGSGLLGVAPEPPAAPTPADAVAGQKSKKSWKQGRQGKQKLARAIRFHMSKNEENMARIGDFPFGAFTELVPEADSPLHKLRQGPKWQMCRMAMFLLQMVMNLAKSYSPNPGLIRHFGSGLRTAPRMALLIHHETIIQDQWERQLCRKKNFFARALKEGESLKVISEGVITQDPDNEWKVHLEEDTREKCKLLIQEHAEHYTEKGMVSKVDNAKNYENMVTHQSWEAGVIYAVYAGCIFHWVCVCTAVCLHPCSSGLVVETEVSWE